MTSARKELFDVETAGVYHCYTRCVRRAFLCGFDKLTGRDYSHRKDWVRDRIEFLENLFFIDNYAFDIISNHTHLILANRPDQMSSASEEEIAIPDTLAPILTRLGIKPPGFYELTTKFGQHFFRVVGKFEIMRELAQRKGKSWFVGLSSARMFFA